MSFQIQVFQSSRLRNYGAAQKNWFPEATGEIRNTARSRLFVKNGLVRSASVSKFTTVEGHFALHKFAARLGAAYLYHFSGIPAEMGSVVTTRWNSIMVRPETGFLDHLGSVLKKTYNLRRGTNNNSGISFEVSFQLSPDWHGGAFIFNFHGVIQMISIVNPPNRAILVGLDEVEQYITTVTENGLRFTLPHRFVEFEKESQPK